MKIDDELKSRFDSPLHKAHVNIIFTAIQLEYLTSQVLKPYGLSTQQYNILRILRGQNSKPAPLKLLSERMLDRMSNTSRLVDKLVNKHYVRRSINPGNRRQVDIIITDLGLEVLEKSSIALDKKIIGTNMTHDELEHLSALLDKFRG